MGLVAPSLGFFSMGAICRSSARCPTCSRGSIRPPTGPTMKRPSCFTKSVNSRTFSRILTGCKPSSKEMAMSCLQCSNSSRNHNSSNKHRNGVTTGINRAGISRKTGASKARSQERVKERELGRSLGKARPLSLSLSLSRPRSLNRQSIQHIRRSSQWSSSTSNNRESSNKSSSNNNSSLSRTRTSRLQREMPRREPFSPSN
mmetsp:Transcript_9503/g.20662  ORF Transcript_9503/g.20662 Transcript_9503/m.20662 type:complete len:202 (+) Transcript_9503:403-1008(+)